MPLDIDPAQYARLQQYCAVTGVPIEVALREALDDYLDATVAARLEALGRRGAQA